MEKAKKLNTLAETYSQTKCEKVFNEIYEILSLDWNKSLVRLSYKLQSSPEEVRATYEDTLIKVLDSQPSQFDHMLNRSLKNARANLYRKSKMYRERQPLIVDYESDEDDRAVHDIVDDETTESRYLERQTKSDQRQLIAFLTDPARVNDDMTIEIIKSFPQYKSVTALAKALGLDHKQVSRRIEKLAKNFDAESFGDYRDYLSVS